MMQGAAAQLPKERVRALVQHQLESQVSDIDRLLILWH